MLSNNDFVVITGGPGTGKTALARYIALKLHRDESREIVLIKNPADIFEFLDQCTNLLLRKNTILVIDDLIGRQTVCKEKSREFVRLYEEKVEGCFVRPFQVIATCRSKISASPEFISLQKLYWITECNISEVFVNSLAEMREIALCHINTQTVDLLFKNNIHEHDNFYTLCFLSSKLNQSTNLDFFVNTSQSIEEKINNMYKNNQHCFLLLALLVIFDGRISKYHYEDSDEQILFSEIMNYVREESNLKSIQNSQILQGNHQLVRQFVSVTASEIIIIHPELVHILSVCFFNTIPKSMLKYGSDDFIQMKVQLKSIAGQVSPDIILIEKCLEDDFFNRLIHDIKNEQYENAFDNIQMANDTYQEKLISYISESFEIEQMVISDFAVLLLSIKNGASKLVNFFIVECKNHNYLMQDRKRQYYYIYDERGILKLYPHIQEESLLLLACLKGQDAVAKVLLNLGFDKNYQDGFQRTPLHVACLNGHIDVVKLLLEKKCDVNLCNSDGDTALHHACFFGYTDIVNILLHNYEIDAAECPKPDYTMSNNYMNTPLFNACEKGHLDIVKIFVNIEKKSLIPVSNPFDNTITNNYERTMLHVACKNGNSGIIEILLERNFDVNETDSKGRTPLFYACKRGNTQIVELLLHKEVDVDISDNSGRTPLYMSCGYCHDNVVLLLLKAQCKLNTGDRNGKTPLHVAVQNNSATIIDMLMMSHSDTDRSYTEKEQTIIYKRNTNDTMYSCDINAHDDTRQTALHIACIKGFVECVKTLLKYKCDINKCDEENKTPLHYACENREELIVELLLNCDIDVNILDKNGKSPLHIAVEKENLKTLKSILQCHNCQVDSMYEDSFYGVRSALHIAIEKENTPMVKALLDSNCDVNQRGPRLQTPFMYACETWSDAKDIQNLLLDRDCDINTPDLEGITPLHVLCKHSDIQLINIILGKVKDINATDNFGRNALHYASQYSNISTVDLLIKQRCDINKQDSNNETPIFYAASTCNCTNKNSNIQRLLRSHCNINVANNKGMTMLHVACFQRDSALVKTLIKKGCDVTNFDMFGRTALHIAAEYCRKETIAMLVKMCDVNVKNKNGQTSLHIACQTYDLEKVNQILQAESDVNMQDNSGTTAVHIAVIQNDSSLVKALLNAKCDVDIRDEIGLTPLLYAVEKRNTDIVKLLLNYNCDVTIHNKYGKNAQQIAEMKGYTDIVNMLSLFHS